MSDCDEGDVDYVGGGSPHDGHDLCRKAGFKVCFGRHCPLPLPPDEAQSSAVDGPAHYGGKNNPYEVIKVMCEWFTIMEVIAFCKLNAVKYLARAGKKGSSSPGEDLRKAEWYIGLAASLHETGEMKR